MALDKITTDIIADDAVTAAKIPAGAVGSSEIAATYSPTVLKQTDAQNLTGTYSTHDLIIGKTFTVTGDLTINANLVLCSLSGTGDDVTIQPDSTARTITSTGGTGTLEGGEVLAKAKSDLTGMTGELGSVVTGTLGSGVIGGSGLTALGTVATGNLSNTAIVYPSGHVLQVKTHVLANASLGTSSLNWPSTAIGFDSAIQSSSDVLMFFSATYIDSASGISNYFDVYVNGGGLGSGSSGRYIIDSEFYKMSAEPSMRETVTVHTLDEAPASTTPTYNFWFSIQGSTNLTISRPHFTFMEIAR